MIIANVVRLCIDLCICVVPRNPLGLFLQLWWGCRDRLGGLFWPGVVADYVGPAHGAMIACWGICQRPMVGWTF